MYCSNSPSHAHCRCIEFPEQNAVRCCHCGKYFIEHQDNVIPLPISGFAPFKPPMPGSGRLLRFLRRSGAA